MTDHDDRKTLNDMQANFTITAYQFLRKLPPWSNTADREILHQRILPFATYAPWLGDAEFIDTFNRILQHTLVDQYRCFELWSLGKQMVGVEGDLLEVGVWRGGTGVVLARSTAGSGKKVYLADTFSGVVKAGEKDTRYIGGEHADTSVPLVEAFLQEFGLNDAILLQGIFPEDTAHRIPGKLAMVHCDVDVYESARDVVEWALPRLSSGGVIVFDDYGFSGCEGVTRLANEYQGRPDLLFLYNLNGHGILMKK
jgi:O-methyltransferase